MAEISNAGLKSKLKALSDQQQTKSARIGAGGGLHLLVKPSAKPGRGVWVLRVTVNRERRDMGLGTYPEVGLADARLAAAQAKASARGGVDPILQRADQKAAVAAEGSQRFREVALECISFKEGGWKNPKHPDQWRRTLAACRAELHTQGLARFSLVQARSKRFVSLGRRFASLFRAVPAFIWRAFP